MIDGLRTGDGARLGAAGVPLNVLYSVGLTETGRRGELGPYDMNVDGREVHSTVARGDGAFRPARGHGAKFIDVGCMQINLRFPGQSFTHYQMFDPARNVGYAANFLKCSGAARLLDTRGRPIQCRARQSAGGGPPLARSSATLSRADLANGRRSPALCQSACARLNWQIRI